MKLAALALALPLIAGGCTAEGQEARYGLNGRVIDGDTLVVNGATIRLWGIDAPEKAQSCAHASGAVYRCGLRAAAHLHAMVRDHRVTCRPRDRDRYGRTVATCGTAHVPDIGERMVRDGWAVEYRRYSGGRYRDAENEARAAKRGLWSGSFQDPAAWRREHPR